MKIYLTLLPDSVEGTYDHGDRKGTFMPERLRYLHPQAAVAYLAADAAMFQLTGHGLRVTDMLRSAESSLAAKLAKRGAARPAFSGHNFGFSIDLDLDVILQRTGWSKKQLDDFMASHGWYCYWRTSDAHELEDWHYNYFGDDPKRWLDSCGNEKTTGGLEAKILALYGTQFLVSVVEAQRELKIMRFYTGTEDGIPGPLMRAGLGAFQRAWNLIDDGTLNIKTQRTLAFLAAEPEIVAA